MELDILSLYTFFVLSFLQFIYEAFILYYFFPSIKIITYIYIIFYVHYSWVA